MGPPKEDPFVLRQTSMERRRPDTSARITRHTPHTDTSRNAMRRGLIIRAVLIEITPSRPQSIRAVLWPTAIQ
jgi:hypothetical protein